VWNNYGYFNSFGKREVQMKLQDAISIIQNLESVSFHETLKIMHHWLFEQKKYIFLHDQNHM
jgi:hypothetical protein